MEETVITYQEIQENARSCMGPYCKSCPTCNGLGCRNTVPGSGAKGTGFIRNYQKWQELCLNMDTICENKPVDTSLTLFGQEVSPPVFAVPIGAMQLHYGDKYDDLAYNDILVAACARAGIAGFTGDGANPAVMEAAEAPKSREAVAELKEIVKLTEGTPFILKGIMTVRGAEKALEAGASGIVVSNHGGRVLDQCPSTAEVLPAIADAAGGKLKILVDGGIRTGLCQLCEKQVTPTGPVRYQRARPSSCLGPENAFPVGLLQLPILMEP